MDIKKLKLAEKRFIKRYPGGFNHPEIVELKKKHNVDKWISFAKENLSEDSFIDKQKILASVSKVVTSSSLVSVFEKPKYRDFIKGLSLSEQKFFVSALNELLHGKEKVGFESCLELLGRNKLAKWTLITIVQAYYKPKTAIFVKPTTTKNIIDHYGMDLIYKPKPTWNFYKKYRIEINKMKKEVDKSLSPNGPAFTGFLMMSFMSELD